MNAPNMQSQAQPGMGPPKGGEAYPSGADVMQSEQGNNGEIENPVIAGFRSIMMFVGELQKRQDPRAAPAAEHLAGLLQTLQGAAQESPIGVGPQPTQAGADGAAPGGPGLMPGAPPGASGQPPAPTVPGAGPQGMAFDPFTDPEADAMGKPQPKARPMQGQPMQPGKRPVVLA